MRIEGISPLQMDQLARVEPDKAKPTYSEFGQVLQNALENVNQIQKDADIATQDFLLGKK